MDHVVRIDHVAAGLGHFLSVFAKDQALVDQLVKRFRRRDAAEVKKHLVPEPRVEKMQHRMLGAANVKIDAGSCSVLRVRPAASRIGCRAHPILFGFRAAEGARIVRVQVP